MEYVWRLAVGVLSRELVPDGCHLISGGGADKRGECFE